MTGGYFIRFHAASCSLRSDRHECTLPECAWDGTRMQCVPFGTLHRAFPVVTNAGFITSSYCSDFDGSEQACTAAEGVEAAPPGEGGTPDTSTAAVVAAAAAASVPS